MKKFDVFVYLRSVLRRAWMRSPERGIALQNAYVCKLKNEQGREVKMYRCANCLGLFPAKEVDVDHIENLGSIKSFHDVGVFCERLFVTSDKLQVLCKPCHKEKTFAERRKSKR